MVEGADVAVVRVADVAMSLLCGTGLYGMEHDKSPRWDVSDFSLFFFFQFAVMMN